MNYVKRAGNFNTNSFCIDDVLDIVKAKKKKLKKKEKEKSKGNNK